MGWASFYRDRTAILTGASEGIGLELAGRLVELGSDVAICSRSETKLRKAMSELRNRSSRPDQKMICRAFDVVDYDATAQAVRSIVDEIGPPDLLVNCAGFARPGYLDELEPGHLQSMIEVNFLGTAHACKAALPHLADGRSHILNTASVAGFIGLFGYTGYCASKYAVIGFSEALRNELRPRGIKVSVLCPPNTRTPGLERENEHKPDEVRAVEEKVAVLSPEAVAEAALRALPKGPMLIHPNWDGRAAHWLSRLFPGLIRRIVRRRV